MAKKTEDFISQRDLNYPSPKSSNTLADAIRRRSRIESIGGDIRVSGTTDDSIASRLSKDIAADGVFTYLTESGDDGSTSTYFVFGVDGYDPSGSDWVVG